MSAGVQGIPRGPTATGSVDGKGTRAQRGSFASEEDARAALERALEELRPRGMVGRMGGSR